MKKALKSLVGLLLITALVVSSLVGCSPKENDKKDGTKQTQQSASTGETRKFTDSAGREVELPKDIKRIAPSGSLAQIVLYSISPDKIIGWSKAPGDNVKKYMDKKYWDLPEFGQFYGKAAGLNRETLIKEKPDVIIDIGDKKKTVKEDMDNIQKDVNIPTIFIEGTLDKMEEAYKTLGDLLGEEEAGKKLAEYTKKTLDEANTKVSSIKDGKKVKIYYAGGPAGLNTNAKGSIHEDTIVKAGGDNVAVLKKDSEKKDAEKKDTDKKDGDKKSSEKKTGTNGSDEISMEQLIQWNPDVIIFSPDGMYDKVATDKAWKNLKAIKEGKYYQIPNEPYNWIGMPPSVNRLIGVKWLGNLMYPDVFKYDMVKETKEFYKLFYHYDLSDKDAKELMNKSTFK